MSFITVRGTLTKEDIECPTLRGDDGNLYTMVVLPQGYEPGDYVEVVGSRVDLSICSQGITIAVKRIEKIDRAQYISKSPEVIFPLSNHDVSLPMMNMPSSTISGKSALMGQLSPKLVHSVSEVKIMVNRSQRRNVTVFAIGKVTSGGWTPLPLFPVMYFAEPADGIYDFDFYALPPAGVTISPMLPIVGEYYWGVDPDKVKGIRVNAETNSMVEMIGDDLIEDPSRWTGCVFVPSGEHRRETTAVHEDDIKSQGYKYVIVGRSPQATHFDFRPNRLRIRLDENSIIISVAWG